jgi:hypothetical protein
VTKLFDEAVIIAKQSLESSGIESVEEQTLELMALEWAVRAKSTLEVDAHLPGLIAAKFNGDERTIPDLITFADTHPIAFRAAAILATDLLNHEITIPEPLKVWMCDVLKGEKMKPPTPPDAKRGFEGQHHMRDMYITWAVDDVIETLGGQGIKRTRGGTSPEVTAIDAVARAMQELGLKPTSYSRVRIIYEMISKG